MSEIKLLPCPICNGEVGIALFGCGGEEWYSITRFADEENSCQCRLFMESEKFFAEDDESVKEKHKQDLINRWNKRKTIDNILKKLFKKEEMELVAYTIEKEKIFYDGYVKGIKKAIEVVEKEGGVE